MKGHEVLWEALWECVLKEFGWQGPSQHQDPAAAQKAPAGALSSSQYTAHLGAPGMLRTWARAPQGLPAEEAWARSLGQHQGHGCPRHADSV